MEKQTPSFSGINNQHRINLAVKLWDNRHSLKHKQAEYYYFDQLFNISQYTRQDPICIIGSHRNMRKSRDYRSYIESVANQNYTNYRVVLIDDGSTDGSDSFLRRAIEEEFPVLKSKLYFIKQHQPLGSLKTRAAPSQYCAGSRS